MSELGVKGSARSDEKLLFVLGLSVKAGAVIFGVPQICEALGKKKKNGKYPLLVIEASDTSDNTRKRISDKCSYYNVKHVKITTSTEALAHALGKGAALAAVAITDENLCRLAEKHIDMVV